MKAKESTHPPKEFKLNILQGEIESNEDLLERIETENSGDTEFDEEEYDMFKEELSKILKWVDDIKNENPEVLSREDMEFRLETLQNEISCHEDVLRMDDSLTDEDIEDIKESIKNIKDWRRDLRKWKKASC